MKNCPIEPPIRDDSGYRVTKTDLSFLQISSSAIAEWQSRKLPLGLSGITFGALKAGLRQAIKADGIDLEDVDVRLKGSASSFFSGRHKSLPTERDELIAEFRVLRGRFPALFELEEIERRLHEWAPKEPRPKRRPFDSMFQLGIDRARSDYDLQISSDQIVAKCENSARAVGMSVTREVTFNDAYNFVRKDLIRMSMKNLAVFALDMSDALQREVTLAVFPSCGPPDSRAEIGELSAHFRSSDWIIHLPENELEGSA